MNKVTGAIKIAANSVINTAKKYSPEILLTVGVTGLVASAAWAIKETINIKEETKPEIDEIHNIQNIEVTTDEEAREKVRKNTKAVLKLCVKLAKKYGMPLTLALASVSSIVASYSIMKSRSAALAASMSAVLASFADYRQGVIDRYGQSVDQELFTGVKPEIIQVIDPETGEISEREIKVQEDPKKNPYLFVYKKYHDDGSINTAWYDHKVSRDAYIISIEKNLTRELQYSGKNGHVWLNTVRKCFDPESETQFGQVNGWEWAPGDPMHDNFISCRAQEIRVLKEDGTYETQVLMNFNCDGNVLHCIDEM